MKKIAGIIFLIFIFCKIQNAEASHAMAVDLTYRCLGGNNYEFTLSFYRDCKGIAAPANPVLHIESATCGAHYHINLTKVGSGTEVSAICNSMLSQTTCNGGTLPGVQQHVYKGTYNLGMACSDWTFSYSECCRNNIITNLTNKGNIFVQARLNNLDAPCNSSPIFTTLPVPYICANQPFSYNQGALDSDGDSLVYSLAAPLQGNNTPVSFQSGYSSAYPIQSTTGSVSLNSVTGQFDVTPLPGQVSVMAVQVKEYRNGVLIGSTVRDMQVIVQNCTNLIPYITNGEVQNVTGGTQVGPNQIEVCPGTPIAFDIISEDQDPADVISVSTNLSSSIPGANFLTTGTNPVTGHFTWVPSGADVGLRVFTVTVKDDACQVSGQQTYTFSINVLSGVYAGRDAGFCPKGGPVQLKATGGTSFSWTMLDGSPAVGLSCSNCSDPLATPTIPSTYVVTSNISGNCKNKDTVSVNPAPDFNITTSSGSLLCSVDNGVVISATPDLGSASSYTYSWTPEETLNNSSIYNPIAKPRITTKYYVTITSPQKCTLRDSLIVEVNSPISITAVPRGATVTCDTVNLDVILHPPDDLMNEHFDHELDSSLFVNVSNGAIGSNCGAQSHDAFYFNGAGQRLLETEDFDLITGGTIRFFIKGGNCNLCVCDRPENGDQVEDMIFEYSTDGGNSWNSFAVFDADLYSGSVFYEINLQIPDAAKSPATRFRWHQLAHNGLNRDIWILDELSIRKGLGTYTYQWTPANTLSDGFIKNPIASPRDTTTYVVLVTDVVTGCVYVDSVTLNFRKDFSLVVTPDTSYCQTSNNGVILSANATPNVGFNYTWFPTSGISSSNGPAVMVNPNVTTKYFIVVENPVNGCYQIDSVEVKVHPGFTLQGTKDTSTCELNSLPLEVITSVPGKYYYDWSDGKLVSDSTIYNPTTNLSTDATLYVTVIQDSTWCRNRDTINIRVFPDFELEIIEDQVICPYETEVTIHAQASPGNDFIYSWSPDAGMADPSNFEQVVGPLIPTTYYVTAHRPGQCYKRESVHVGFYNSVLNLSVIGDQTIYQGENVTLIANGATYYLWRPNSFLSDSVSSFITVAPDTSTLFTIIGYDECYADTQFVNVSVIPILFFIPNLITPNGDLKNDKFEITNYGKFFSILILNRWGDVIYSKDEYANEWGENIADGVYYYEITDKRTNKIFKGWVDVKSSQ